MILLLLSACNPKENSITKSSTGYLVSKIALNLTLIPLSEKNLAIVKLSVLSNNDVKGALGIIELPAEFELIEGKLEWRADLEKDKSRYFNVTVKKIVEGNSPIQASIIDNTAKTKFSTKISPSLQIEETMEEYCKSKKRSYEVALPARSFQVNPRKGQESIDYFNSIELSEPYVYVLIQFEACDGDPLKEEMDNMAQDGIQLYEYHGDHTYYARIPTEILRTKSYDFVRWIGLVDNPLDKIRRGSVFWYLLENCTGNILLNIGMYDTLTQTEENKLRSISLIRYAGNIPEGGSYLVEIETNKLRDLLSLPFVKKIEVYTLPTLSPPGASWKSHMFINVSCIPQTLVLTFDSNVDSEIIKSIEILNGTIMNSKDNNTICANLSPLYLYDEGHTIHKHLTGFKNMNYNLSAWGVSFDQAESLFVIQC